MLHLWFITPSRKLFFICHISNNKTQKVVEQLIFIFHKILRMIPKISLLNFDGD